METGWISGKFDGESIGERTENWNPEHRHYDLILARGVVRDIQRIPAPPDVDAQEKRCTNCGQEYGAAWGGTECDTCKGPVSTWNPLNSAQFAVRQPTLLNAVFELPSGPVRCELKDVVLVDWTLENRGESDDRRQAHGWIQGRIYGRLDLPHEAPVGTVVDPSLPPEPSVGPVGPTATPLGVPPVSGGLIPPGGCGSSGCGWLLGIPLLGLLAFWLFGWPLALLAMGIALFTFLLAMLFRRRGWSWSPGCGGSGCGSTVGISLLCLGLWWAFGWPMAILGLGLLMLPLLLGLLATARGWPWTGGCGGLLGLGLLGFVLHWLFGWPTALLCLGILLFALLLSGLLFRFLGIGRSTGCLSSVLILAVLLSLPLLLWRMGGAGAGCLGIVAILILTALTVGLLLAVLSRVLRVAIGLAIALVIGFMIWGLLISPGGSSRYEHLGPGNMPSFRAPWGGTRPMPTVLPRSPWREPVIPTPSPEAQARAEFETAKAAPEGKDLLSLDDAMKDPEAFFGNPTRRLYLSGGLLFGSDSDSIGPDGGTDLQKLAQLLRKRPDARIQLEGHADTRGTEPHNLELSERRAGAIKKRLVEELGIDADQVEIMGIGSSHPLVPTGDKATQGPNRRVEVRVVKKTEGEDEPSSESDSNKE